MSKEMLKNLIEFVPEEDVEILYKVIIKFIPKSVPEPDEPDEEIEAIREGRKDRAINGTVSHNAINFD